MSQTVRRLVSLACLGFGMLLYLTACDKILFSESTRYAPRYSDAAFQGIRVGMSMDQVTNLLGCPLATTTQEWYNAWVYAPGDVGAARTGARGEMEFGLFGPYTRLCFDRSGRVSACSGDYLNGQFIGMDKLEVLRALHRPAAVDERPFRIIFRYSLPRRSGTYKRREVWFDESQVVRSNLAEIYVD